MPFRPAILPAILPVICALCAPPGAALAACPEAGDLETGVEMVFESLYRETYRSGEDGLVMVEGYEGTTLSFQMELDQGIYLTRFDSWDADSDAPEWSKVYTYPRTASATPAPGPGVRWSGDSIVRDPRGMRLERQTVAYADPGTISIGGCQLETLPLVIAYDTEGGYMEGLTYLPDLGFAYLAWHQDAAEGRVDYRPQAISAVP